MQKLGVLSIGLSIVTGFMKGLIILKTNKQIIALNLSLKLQMCKYFTHLLSQIILHWYGIVDGDPMASGVGPGGLPPSPKILADQLTLFKPGGQIMPITLLPAPPPGFRKLPTPLKNDYFDK